MFQISSSKSQAAAAITDAHTYNLLHKQVIAEDVSGLKFKNKRDRKVLNVDPRAPPGDGSSRTELETHEYMQVGGVLAFAE